MKSTKILGMAIGIAGYALMWYFYDWLLPLLFTVMLYGNNIQIEYKRVIRNLTKPK